MISIPDGSDLRALIEREHISYSARTDSVITPEFGELLAEEAAIAVAVKASACPEGEVLDANEICVPLVEPEEPEELIIEEKKVQWNVGTLSDYVKLKLMRENGEIIELEWELINYSKGRLDIGMTAD